MTNFSEISHFCALNDSWKPGNVSKLTRKITETLQKDGDLHSAVYQTVCLNTLGTTEQASCQ